MADAQLSTRQQIGLVLGSLIAFALILAYTGSMASDQASQQMAGLASDGAVVTGRVTNKYIHTVAKTWVYWLDVEFKTQNGSVEKGSINVANTIYDGLKVGGPVQVRYVRSRPEWFFVPGTEPTQESIGLSNGISKFGIAGGVLLAAGLLGWFFWPSGGGTPAREIAADPLTPKPEAPLRSASGPRTSFGTRQYRG
jgi:hypothetical protein